MCISLFERVESSAPVEAGETYDVVIEDIAKKGDGIARVDGFVIFLPCLNQSNVSVFCLF